MADFVDNKLILRQNQAVIRKKAQIILKNIAAITKRLKVTTWVTNRAGVTICQLLIFIERNNFGSHFAKTPFRFRNQRQTIYRFY
jgi:hypothetical protein